MEAVTTLPRGRALLASDLDAMPDDGHRYEVIDGTLIVTPAPSFHHQHVVAELLVLLHAACPDDMVVLTAPFDVVLAEDTGVQPDLLVAPRASYTARALPTAPTLAVEVLSPSTRLLDLNLKRARYERAGASAYWVVDPDELRLAAWELREGRFVEVADVTGHEEWHATVPFPVTVVPASLL